VAEQLTIKINADLSGLGSGLNDAARQVSSFGDTLKGAFLGGLGADLAARAFGAFTSGITDAIHALAEVDRISGQTAAVIKSTGGAAGVAAADVTSLADSIERKTGIEAESIQKGQNLLLTFTNIKNAAGANNDIFNQATAIMADLGTAMGTDASGAAIQLGKALNDPTAGITALTRVGVTFTDGQKATIKSLQESGDLMGAQKIILAELSKEFGGSADAAGKTFAGALDRAKNAIGSISEAMVGPAVPIFTAALIKVSNAAYAISDAITDGRLIQLFNQAFGPGTKSLVVGLAAVMTASLAPSIVNVGRQAVVMAAAYTRALAAMAAANAPLVAAIATISFAVYPFIKNWDTVKNLFLAAWQTMVNGVNSAWQTITGAAKNAFEILSGNFRAAYYNAVSFFIGPLTRSFNALFNSLPDSIKTALGGLKFAMPKFELGAGAGAAFESFKASAVGALDTVRGAAMIAKENFVSTWGDLPGEIRGVMNGFNSVLGASSATAQKSFAAIGDSGAAMGDRVAGGAKKAGKEIADKTKKVKDAANVNKELETSLGFLFKNLSTIIPRVQMFSDAWRDAKDLKAAEERTRELAKVIADATKKIEDIDRVSRYWSDTSDKTAEKQKILRDAIDELTRDSVEPASPLIAELRAKYDELGASALTTAAKTQEAKDKTDEFAATSQTAQGLLGGFSGLLGVLGGGESPIVGFVGTMQKGIGAVGNMRDIQVELAKAFGDTSAQAAVAGKSFASLGLEAAMAMLIFKGIEIWSESMTAALGGWPGVFDLVTIGFQAMGWTLAFIGENIIGGTINAIGKAWTGLQNLVIDGVNILLMGINATIRGMNALGANIPELGYLERKVSSDVQIDFTSGIVSAMGETFKRMTGRVLNAGSEEKIEKATKAASAAMDRLKESLETADKKAKVWGAGVETVTAKQNAYRSAIDELLRAGIDPASESIKALKTKFDELEKMASRGGFDESYQGVIEGANALMQRAIDTGDEALRLRAAEAFRQATEEGNYGRNQITINVTGSGRYSAEDARQIGQLIVGELKASGVR